ATSRTDIRSITADSYSHTQKLVDSAFGSLEITDNTSTSNKEKTESKTSKPSEADWNKASTATELKLDGNTWKAVTQEPVTPDCPLISEIIKTAHDNPEKIRDLIRVEKGANSPSDDTYLVKLPGAKSPDEIIRVTQDDLRGCNGRQLKTDASGNPDPARTPE